MPANNALMAIDLNDAGPTEPGSDREMESPSLCPDHIGRPCNCSLPECALVELTAAQFGGCFGDTWTAPNEVAQQTRERHFDIPVLEAVLHRGLDLALELPLSCALTDEIGIATEILGPARAWWLESRKMHRPDSSLF